MLKSLWVENYALIRKIEIQFDSGFHVITGETGAGKSILVGALSLLLGQRADFSMVSDAQKKCIVEGVFDVSDLDLSNFFDQNDIDNDPSLIIRREINPQGKSRAFINDTPVGLNLLKELSSKLFDIHSQHENLLIAQKDFQLNLIDQFAQNQELKSQYKKIFSEFKKLDSELNQLKESEAKTIADRDYFGFLFNELSEAQLQEEELPKIEEELKSIQNIENIKQQLLKTDSILSTSEFNVLELTKEVRTSLQEISDYYTPAKDLHTRIHSVIIEIDDLAKEVAQLEDNLNFDPEKVALLTERLNVLNHLCTKHRVGSDKELIEIKNQMDEKLQQLSSSSDRLEACSVELEKCKKELSKIADKLSQSRLKVMNTVCDKISVAAKDLGMPDAKLEFTHSILTEFSSNGIDSVELMFSANKGVALRPLEKIASGGELSRIMLAVKSIISERTLIPIIIFDEIDTGVSGDIASKVAVIMKKMANNMQVIAITHLPQIAAKAKTHYWVYKKKTDDITESDIKVLNEEERVVEIAKMISNDTVTDVSMMAAKELLC